MISVKDILRNKSKEVWQIGPDATVYEALELLADKDIGALPVVADGKLAGMFSERDYARKVILHGKNSRETSVGELMSSPVITIGPDEPIERCMLLMTDHHIRHLPVLEAGAMVGLVSIGDVLKAMIDDQRVAIRDLENYITGRRD
jgi:CBS domain-containing protein